jgi:ABC-2 type transport system permease protein
LFLASSGLFGLGIGTLTRDTAGAITVIFGVELLVPGFSPSFPGPLPHLVDKYWPTQAGARILTTRQDPTLLGPWTGFGVMAGATTALLGAAALAFGRRDE